MKTLPSLLLALLAGLSAHAADILPRMLLLDGAFAGRALVVVGERGTILRSSDDARTWQTARCAATATLTGIAFAPDGTHGWAVGHDAVIFATADAGQSWTQEYQGGNIQDSFLGVLAVDAGRVLAVGAYGLFAASTDGGKTWSRRKLTGDDYHLNRISQGPTGTLYIAGEHGTLLRSVDRGDTWSKLSAPYEGSFYGLLPLDRRTLIAHGLRGRVFRSIDDGVTWAPVETPQPVLLAASLRLKSNFILLAGQARALLLSRDYGKSFEPTPLAVTTGIAELLELPDGRVLALGESGATVLPKP